MVVLILAMAFGIGVSVYMAQHHEVSVYGGPDAMFELVGCEEAEGVSCDVVNTSEWSEVFGVPTFAWAVPTYFAFAVLGVMALRGRRSAAWLVVLGGLLTSAFSGFLWYISAVELGNVCLWCMRLYAVNFATPVLGLAAAMPMFRVNRAPLPSGRTLGVGIGAFVTATVVTVLVQQGYRSSLLGDAPTDAALTAVVEVPDDPLAQVDPEGELEPRELTVTTEDGNTATLKIAATDAWKGNPDADVVLVEFADLECGFCKRAASELDKVYRAYGDRVLFVFKHYPMDRACNPGVKSRKHRDACIAAQAAICAQEQGRFWAFHDLAFKNQHELDAKALQLYADTLELEPDAFRRCVTSPQTADRLRSSGQAGADLDIHGTPRIFIDGTLYRSGSSARQLAKALEAALGIRGTEAASRMRAIGGPTASPVVPIADDVQAQARVRMGEVDVLVDTFESGLDDGAATTGKHVIPATRMSWYAARDACAAAGKRLCTEREWLTACQSADAVDDDNDGEFADDMIEGSAYPYGDFHDPRRCWSARKSDEERPVYTGEMPGCVGASGVYDLVGNVEEWVGATPEEAVLLGGAWDTRSDKARCYRRNDTYGAGYASPRTGFRCCQDPSDAGTPTADPVVPDVDTDGG